jgi:IS30 family transposase
MLMSQNIFKENRDMRSMVNNNIKEAGSKGKHITETERYKIEGYKQAKMSNRAIAKLLRKSHSSINEEIKRGSIVQKKSDLTDKIEYKADYDQMKAKDAGKNKGAGLKIGKDHKSAGFSESKIRDEKYSPDAALSEARKQGGFETMICTKTLYAYIDSGLFLGISNKDLLIKKAGKKRNYQKIRKVALNNKKGKGINEWPREADDRLESGHWEIDLAVGKQGTKPVVLTLVERKSRKSVYLLLKNKTQEEVVEGLKRAKKRFGGDFSGVFKTITADNGSEFLNSDGIKEALNCEEVYYAHPYSSWERGSNENGNRMLRRFIPKGTDLNELTEAELQKYEDWINNYPRRLLNYKTANEMYIA